MTESGMSDPGLTLRGSGTRAAMPPAWRPIMAGVVLALIIVALFRVVGPAFFVEGRTAANLHALGGAGAGFALGWAMSRGCCGLRGVVLATIPGVLILAAVTSHFGLAFPALAPSLDKGFGGLMLWFYGFFLTGGFIAARGASCALN
jgi:hypothetical protein